MPKDIRPVPFSKKKQVELKHRFRRLFSCPSWPEMQKRILAGAGPGSIADELIKRGEYAGVSKYSVARQVYRYIQGLPAAQKISRPYVDEAIEQFTAGLNEIQEMEFLIAHQMQRIGIDSLLEKRMNKLLTSQRNEITALFEMLERLIRIKQELGILPRVPSKTLVAGAFQGKMDVTLREALEGAGGDVTDGGIMRMIGQAFAKSQTKQLPGGGQGDGD